jgi:pyruvate dehydrogenase E2 component (dihydrolipoamide acetyltransferase)
MRARACAASHASWASISGASRGRGPRSRILKEDIQGFVKGALAGGGASPAAARGGGFADLGLPAWPKVDFAKFGPIEAKPLTRIQKISGPALARNWVMIPHVTQFDEADITELEAFRAKVNEENAKAASRRLRSPSW